jgi:hypothetical protein
MARPSKKNPTGAQKPQRKTVKVLALLSQAASLGCTNLEACIHAGISEKTYYLWIKNDKKLSDELERLKNTVILKARKAIVGSLTDPQHAKWYLERKLKNEFSLKIENDHTSSDGSMTPANQMTDEQLAQIASE